MGETMAWIGGGGAGPRKPGEATAWRNEGGGAGLKEALKRRLGKMGTRQFLREQEEQEENRRRETGSVEGKLRVSVCVKKNLGPDWCVKYCKNTTVLAKP